MRVLVCGGRDFDDVGLMISEPKGQTHMADVICLRVIRGAESIAH